MPKVLVVDDDLYLRQETSKFLGDLEGWSVTVASTGEECLQNLTPEFDAILLDLRLHGLGDGIDGETVLARIRKQPAFDRVCIVVLTAHGEVASANRALTNGAQQYLQKPIALQKLTGILSEAILLHQAQTRDRPTLAGIIGQCPSIREVVKHVLKVSQTDSAVLLHGETGTGKELIARAIHGNSPRRNRPWVPVNVAAIPVELMASTLFGHLKGAFTGAIHSRVGLFEAATKGTLFLDEVGDMPLAVQVGFLRALQEKRIMRVGDAKETDVDARIIAATSKHLPTEVREGRFREDLWYRLDVFPITVPPLRSRKEDIEPLAHHFLTLHKKAKKIRGFTSDAIAKLEAHSWPGNVRELSNLIERAIIIADGDIVTPDLLVFSSSSASTRSSPIGPYREAKLQFDRGYFTQLLNMTDGDVAEAAKIAGLNKTAVYDHLHKLGLREPRKVEQPDAI